MARFPLSGLLRLRQLEKDAAAGDLALANSRLAATAERAAGERTGLSGIAPDAVSTASLVAIAAARSAMQAALADLADLAAVHRAEADEAGVRLNRSRADALGLEKLEARHRSALDDEELRAEQHLLDEFASVGRGAAR